MRTAFLLLMMLFCFTKNGFSIVAPAAQNIGQSVENQQVARLKSIVKIEKKASRLIHFFKKRAFKKFKKIPTETRIEIGNTLATIAIITGLVACLMFIPTILLAETFVEIAFLTWDLMWLLPLPIITMAIFALCFKTKRKVRAWFGIVFGLLSWALAILLLFAFSGD